MEKSYVRIYNSNNCINTNSSSGNNSGLNVANVGSSASGAFTTTTHKNASNSNLNKINVANGSCKNSHFLPMTINDCKNTATNNNNNNNTSNNNVVDETTNDGECYGFLRGSRDNVCLKVEFNDCKKSNEKEKLNILKEILSSEKKYLNDIREIVEGYYEEIKKCSSDEFVYHIFSNIKDIYEFTKSFFSLLESSTEDEVGIANCFIKKHRVFLRLYSTYCQNYRIAFNTTEKLETENNIAKIIQKVRSKYGHCLKMTTYLQLPVLRITKYHLLLQRYLKLLDKDSFEYNQVLEALELMKQVNDKINEEMAEKHDVKSMSKSDNNDTSLNQNITSTMNMYHLIKLFGTILKQGNLMLTHTRRVHYVIIFQKMLIIRKFGSPNKIMHSISSEFLAFSPTSSNNKSKTFTIIDYSQPKDDEMWQFIFKAKTEDDKRSWQSAILSCMLSGYNKKISDNIKTKVMENGTPNDQTTPVKSAEVFRKKIANFRRLTDFRHSLKNESKMSQDINMSTINIKPTLDDIKRRLSNPMHSSRIVKILDRTMNFGTLARDTFSPHSEKILSKFRHSKEVVNVSIGSMAGCSLAAKFSDSNIDLTPINDSFYSDKSQRQSLNGTRIDFSNLVGEPIEHIRTNVKMAYHQRGNIDNFRALIETKPADIDAQVNTSIIVPNYESDPKEETTLTASTSHEPLEVLKIDEDNNSHNTTNNNDNNVYYGTNRSSKSSINSEEGYYSNHDSSSCSTLIVDNCARAIPATLSSCSSSGAASLASASSTSTTWPKDEALKLLNFKNDIILSSSLAPEFKIEKVSIKKIDLGDIANLKLSNSAANNNNNNTIKQLDRSMSFMDSIGQTQPQSTDNCLLSLNRLLEQPSHNKRVFNLKNHQSSFSTLDRSYKRVNQPLAQQLLSNEDNSASSLSVRELINKFETANL